METIRRCIICNTVKPLNHFYRHKTSPNGRLTRCKICKDVYLNDPKRRLFQSSRINAYAKGLEHTISVDDIPTPLTCRYLGVKIVYRTGKRKRVWNGPSIDRIDSTKGYVPGNIQVISDLANRMKQNATPEQLVRFARGVLQIHGDKLSTG